MNVAVLGAEETARELAYACVLAGEAVSLHADDATAVMDSIDVIEREVDDAGDIDANEQLEVTDRLEGTTGLEAAVADVDLVVDATTRDVSALQERFADIEALVDRDALVASAVPAVSVTNAATGLRHPDRAVGFRVHRLPEPFLEVVLAEQTGPEAADCASRFAESVSGDWITVRDTPGNVSTRLSLALEVAAIRMLDEGVATVDAIDTAFEQIYRTGVGPLERADRIGLDQRYDALVSLSERLGPRFEPPPLLAALVEEGKTGADAGEGFYVWEDGTPQPGALADPTTPGESHRQEPSG